MEKHIDTITNYGMQGKHLGDVRIYHKNIY